MRHTILTCLSAILLISSAAQAANYTIDSSHSQVGFRIKHLAISTVPGRFSKFSGTFSFDPENIAASQVEASINVESINTDDQKRDDHLRNPDFFDATKFPEIKYKAAKVEATGKDTFITHGELTIRNVTKHVMLNVTYLGSVKDPWGKERSAFSATTKINRKDFGLTWNKILETGGLAVGEEVNIQIDIEGIKEG